MSTFKFEGFDWDNGNLLKCRKHGVTTEEIEALFVKGQLMVAPDVAHSTVEETRYIAIGQIEGKYIFAAFTIRDRRIRPISCRYMHEREVKKYEARTQL